MTSYDTKKACLELLSQLSFSLSLSFSFIVLLACRAIIPIALLHCLWASNVEIGFAGLRIVVIFSFMCIGFISWFVKGSEWSMVHLLHSFRNLASLLICLKPALDI